MSFGHVPACADTIAQIEIKLVYQPCRTFFQIIHLLISPNNVLEAWMNR